LDTCNKEDSFGHQSFTDEVEFEERMWMGLDLVGRRGLKVKQGMMGK